ncbi:MAG: putative maltokinase [Bacteroidia bacterium]
MLQEPHANSPQPQTWPGCVSDSGFVQWLQAEVLPNYLKKCRWFAGKARRLKQVRIKASIPFAFSGQQAFLLIIDAYYQTGKLEEYLLPLTFCDRQAEAPERSVLTEWQGGWLMDAIYDADFRAGLFDAVQQNRSIKAGEFLLQFEQGSAFVPIKLKDVGSRVMNFDQSNSALFFGDAYFFKLYRKLFKLSNPELEVVRYLSETSDFRQIPVYAGSISLKKGKAFEITLAIMQQKVSSEGDAWGLFQQQLGTFIAAEGAQKLHAQQAPIPYLQLNELGKNAQLAEQLLEAEAYRWIALLGQRTAEMHNALGQSSRQTAFAPQTFDAEYKSWLSGHFDKLLEKRQQLLSGVMAQLAPEARQLAQQFEESIDLIREYFERIQQLEPQSLRCRIHGDYHLGQVLYDKGDYTILDFEGEPESSISDRKIKHSPLKDVAGMLRSFHYAAYVALYFGHESARIRKRYPQAEALAETWFQAVASVYLNAYFSRLNRKHFRLEAHAEAAALLRLHLLEKAVYEFGYELNGRPDWVIIPLKGIQQILEEYQTR